MAPPIQLIDRRLNGRHKSAANRQRFIRRYKEQIKRAIADSIAGRSITDTASGGEVRIPRRDIKEPEFGYGSGGRRQGVHPGNREFVAGDTLPRPEGGQGGGGGEASDDGGGEDEFVFTLTRDEFMELFFEDLELPNLARTRIASLMEHENVRAGHTHDGVPSNIDVVRSLTGALARRTALRAPLNAEIAELEAELAVATTSEEKARLRAAIAALEERLRTVPFLDPFDLRYRNRVQRPKPCTQAVMFCLMDVSASMDEERKDIAKRFFMLLYHFLHCTYEHVQVVFIRHHTTAQEVNEEEFFRARDTGGTLVSSALDLAAQIVAERYPAEDWNIYTAQASDGDNWPQDGGRCREILVNRLLPALRYYAYVQIVAAQEQQLWTEYDSIRADHPHFVMQKIATRADIYPVFRRLMRKADA